MPKRVRLSRSMPPNTVAVDDSSGYRNPFVVGEHPGQHLAAAVGHGPWPVETAEQAVALYRRLVTQNLAQYDHVVDALLQLRGRDLACSCKPGQPCHADVLLELANAGAQAAPPAATIH